MSDKERQEVINLFKNNIKGYIAINDIQEAITSITYLWIRFISHPTVADDDFSGV